VPDIFSVQKRSEIMSRIRSKDTVAEQIVFKELRRKKVYFQKHYKKAPGKPDIALPRKKIAVFIDGDFWHGRHIERMRQTRKEDSFWVKKLVYNMNRDKGQEEKLNAKGWKVLRVWESDIKRKRTREAEVDKIINFMSVYKHQR
jgi:DNA mismatch endonuclease (patch repair protein)